MYLHLHFDCPSPPPDDIAWSLHTRESSLTLTRTESRIASPSQMVAVDKGSLVLVTGASGFIAAYVHNPGDSLNHIDM